MPATSNSISLRASFSALTCLLLSLALVLSLAACDSGGGNGDGDGPGEQPFEDSFTLNVTGEGVDESFEGASFFGEVTEEGETVFAIYFGEADEETPGDINPNDGFFGVFVRQSGGGVSTQTYTVADIEASNIAPDAFLFALISDSGTSLIGSRSGTLTITSTSNNTIEGTFDMEGVRIIGTTGAETDVTISGSFQAEDATSFNGLPLPSF